MKVVVVDEGRKLEVGRRLYLERDASGWNSFLMPSDDIACKLHHFPAFANVHRKATSPILHLCPRHSLIQPSCFACSPQYPID